MAKDPAFLFYPADWLVGTMTMTPAQKGTYMDLLCICHQKGGRLTMEDFEYYKCTGDKKIMAKFKKDEHGNFFNVRLEHESQRRKNFTEKQAHNGKKGGRPKANGNPKETQTEPNENPTQTNYIDININDSINVLKGIVKGKNPTLEQWVEFWTSEGYDETRAETIFQSYADNEWRDTNGKPVKNWKMKCRQVWFKPENKKQNNGAHQQSNRTSDVIAYAEQIKRVARKLDNQNPNLFNSE